MEEKLKELTLLMLYLQSWKERGDMYPRSWKGYDFDILNKLSEEDLIMDSRRSKSVYITDEGMEQAKKIAEKYRVEIE